MAMLTGKLPTREETNLSNRDAVDRRVQSNIMSDCAGYFGCDCLEAWNFFGSAHQLQNKMTAWECRSGKVAKPNGYAYGSMTAKRPDKLYHDFLLYFNIDECELGSSFATMPPNYSQNKEFLQTSKQKVTINNQQKNVDRFPIARGPLLSALITSDFAHLGLCQLPSTTKWHYLFGCGAGKGLKLLYKDPDRPRDELPRDHWETAAENLLKKLRSNLGNGISKELKLNQIYLVHGMCKVSRFNNKRQN